MPIIYQPPWGKFPAAGRVDIAQAWQKGLLAAFGSQLSNRNFLSSAKLNTISFGNVASLNGSTGFAYANSVASSAPWTIVAYGCLRASGASSIATTAEAPGNDSRDRSLFITSSGKVAAYIYDGALRNAQTSGTPVVGVPFVAAAVSNSSSLSAWFNSEKSSLSTSNSGYAGYSNPKFVIGYGGGDNTYGDRLLTSNLDLAYCLHYSRALDDSEIRALVGAPWQIFSPARRIIVSLPSAGSSSLSAAGGSILTGTATPSVSYSLAAIGVSASGGSAGPSVALGLSAAGLVVSGGSASPYISGALAASGGSATGGAAGQTATITIQAAGLVQTAGAAGLSPSVLIQAAGAALISGNAELAVTALQAAAGSAQSSGNAMWAAQIAAAAAGTVTTSGIANLSGGAFNYINAAGGSDISGSAGINLSVGIQASGGVGSGGAGHLQQIQVAITAAGIVQSAGAGFLVVHAPLSAFGVTHTGGSANVQNGVVVWSPITSRRVAVPARLRILSVPVHSRFVVVPS